MSSWRGGGEVAALELFSDGVDIFCLRLETIDYTSTKFPQQLTPFKQNGLLSVVALAILNNYTCALLPRFYRTKFLSWTASKNCLPHSKLGFQRTMSLTTPCWQSLSLSFVVSEMLELVRRLQIRSQLEMCSLVAPSTSLRNQL